MYVQCDTVLLVDVFEVFCNKCIEIYELHPAHFLSAPDKAWKAWLKRAKLELKLLTNIDLLLIVKKGIREGIYCAIHRYAASNNIYMKEYIKHYESSFIMYLDANILYGWVMSQKFPVNSFQWNKYISRFSEIFIKNYDKYSDKGYILEVDVEYSKNLYNLHNDISFLQEKMKFKKFHKPVYNL